MHRDLKPGNVFLTREGTVKLLDFGLSHLMAASAGLAPHLAMAGTPAYMAPEQWRGEAQDARTDLWAAGVVLYEMLTGERPFQGATLGELRERVLSEEPAPPVRARNPEVPRGGGGAAGHGAGEGPGPALPHGAGAAARIARAAGAPGGSRLRGGGTQAASSAGSLVLLSCQLTGLAGLVGRLDAEDMGELEAAFQRGCAEVIGQHGGSVNLSMGGEVFACFGCPQVREDDAERAVRAALHLAHEVPERSSGSCRTCPLRDWARRWACTRTGWCWTRAPCRARRRRVVSWLAGQAGPGEVLVSETTWRQVRGAFETEAPRRA